jgi:2Fe-2S ferredoxin
MPRITIIDRVGRAQAIDAQNGSSLMENIRNAGFDDMLALCGGCLSCATCHVYVDDVHIDRLEPMTQSEDDLLNSSDHRRPGSRLSCQIMITDGFDGFTAEIAPED